ncbi:MAG: ABC transporter permease [Beutenbergiaceae bacterium]
MRNLLTRSLSSVVLVVLLAVVMVTMSVMSPHFLGVSNLLSALQLAAPIGIIAIGMTFVILIGGIDLSVGSMFALTSITTGMLCSAGLWLPLAVLVALVVGGLCGYINGYLVAALGLPAIVVTIATMAVYAGIALAISRGSSYPIPPDLNLLGQGSIAGIPTPVIAFLLIFVIAHIALSATAFGDRIYALGTNATAVRYAAQRARAYALSTYILSGVLTAVAAVIYSVMVSSAKSNFGVGYELAAVTIVVVGGAALTGGRGTLWGSLLATVVIAFLQNGLSISFVPTEIQTMFVGGALILTAVIYRWLPQILARPAPPTSPSGRSEDHSGQRGPAVETVGKDNTP